MMFRQPKGSFHQPDPNLLYRTATGDPGGAEYSPLNAVRWLTPPRHIAALVTRTSRTGFAAELYHFGTARRKMAATLYLLKPGPYRMQFRTAGKTITSRPLTATGPQTRVEFGLPPRRPCTLTLRSSE